MAEQHEWAAPESLTIYEVAELERTFTAGDSYTKDRIYDLAATREVDSCGLQWLVAVRARLRAEGASLRLLNVDEPVVESMKLLGIGFLLDHSLEDSPHV